jgi:sensor histidine kinase YesM
MFAGSKLIRLPSTDLFPVSRKKIIWWLALAGVVAAVAVWALVTTPDPVFYFSILWVTLIAFLASVGNRFLTFTFDKVLPWNKWGNTRFFLQLTLGLAFLLLLINGTYYFIKVVLTELPPTYEQLVVMNVWGAAMFIPAYSIYFSLHFLRHWRKSELDMERFQKENIRSQLDSLRNHLDPHFLFNNLNILSSLVDRDQKASRIFINKLAEVYRAILRTKSDDLIMLSEEVGYISSYIYLIKTRFEDNILFHMDLNGQHANKVLPPLTLQMLIENAIKHNLITEARPLEIRLFQPDESHLVVSNTLNRKPAEAPTGLSQSGIANIRQRYAHFTDQEVVVTETETHFEVKVPLLQIEHA